MYSAAAGGAPPECISMMNRNGGHVGIAYLVVHVVCNRLEG